MRRGGVRRILAPTIACLALAACMPSHRMTPELAPWRACSRAEGHAWYSPEEDADNRRLEEWCVTVGPPVVRHRPEGQFPGLAPGDEIGVLSWNADVGGGDLLGFLQAETSVRCVGPRSFLEPGAVPFALLVQEAFRSSADVPEGANPAVVPRAAAEEDRPGGRFDIPEIAERCGLSLVYVAAARNGLQATGGEREDRGAAILSTLPLAEVVFIELPYEAARRVAVAAAVCDSVGHCLRLVNVHFISAAGPARVLTTGNGSRLRQGLAVLDVLRQLGEAGSPADFAAEGMSTLLAGDFNTWSERETVLRHLREVFPDSPPPLGQATHGPFPTDHILFRKGPGDLPTPLVATYARVEDRYHSDHHAVRVGVRFPD